MHASRSLTRRLRFALIAASLGAAGACYRAPTSGDRSPVTVRVDNQSFSDYNVYVIAEQGQAVRLGFAPQKQVSVLRVPDFVLGGKTRSLQFQARPVGEQAGPVSEDVITSPGDEIGLAIPPA